MQLWFSHASGVSLPEQLKTQIILGILSGDLAPGLRLPVPAMWPAAIISTQTRSAPDIVNCNAIVGSNSGGEAASTFATQNRNHPHHWPRIN